MIPTVQFDPATLTIWTTTGALPEEIAALAGPAMAAAVRGAQPAAVLSGVDDPGLRRRLEWLASCVWHEKRHFFDTCLTNYGARRFRDLFSLAGHFPFLAAAAEAAGQPVWFPVETYASPVRRRVLGIPEPSADVLALAATARRMKSMIADLDAGPVRDGRVLHLGGEAQLEGLAQVSQMHAIEHRFGADALYDITRSQVHRLPVEGPYRAIEAISGVLGCGQEDAGGTIRYTPNLAAALMVQALCGRFFGVGAEPEESLVAPWPRLARLIEALGPRPGRFAMPEEEAWALADGAARRLWGRGAIEEIEADIDASEAAAARLPFAGLLNLGDIFADFIALRRRMLAAVRAAGPASLLPRAFPQKWVDRLRPWHIVATPGGDAEAEGAPIVFGAEYNLPPGLDRLLPRRVAWGRLHAGGEEDDRAIGVRDRAAWLMMIEQHNPTALLMLNGRRHRRMVPPELERVVASLAAQDVPIRFDPRFEWPDPRGVDAATAEAVELAAFAGRAAFTCDITGDALRPEQAAVVTPWEFRRSDLQRRYHAEIGYAAVSEAMLAQNWSDWVVRRDLLT